MTRPSTQDVLHTGVNLRKGDGTLRDRDVHIDTLARLIHDMRPGDSDCKKYRQPVLASPEGPTLPLPTPPSGPRPLYRQPGLNVCLDIPHQNRSGKASPADLVAAIQRHSPAVVAACRAALVPVHGAQVAAEPGELTARLKVDRHGQVADASLRQSSFSSSDAEDAILNVLRGLDLNVQLPANTLISVNITVGPL